MIFTFVDRIENADYLPAIHILSAQIRISQSSPNESVNVPPSVLNFSRISSKSRIRLCKKSCCRIQHKAVVTLLWLGIILEKEVACHSGFTRGKNWISQVLCKDWLSTSRIGRYPKHFRWPAFFPVSKELIFHEPFTGAGNSIWNSILLISIWWLIKFF